jgi:hypothetical protein
MRRLVLLVLALSLPAVAHADRHRMGTRAAFQSAARSTLLGIGLGFDVPLHKPSPPVDSTTAGATGDTKAAWWSFVLEASLTTGLHEEEHFAQWIVMGGLRHSFKPPGEGRKFQPFVQALVGPGIEQRGAEEKLTGSASFGAGAEIPILGSTDSAEGLFFLQVDYVVTFASNRHTDGYPQFSAGLTLRLPH